MKISVAQKHLYSGVEKTRIRFAFCLAALFAAAPAYSLVADKTPQETGSPWGAYLSARLAFNERDLSNAELYYRQALQADPHNQDLIEGAFAVTLAEGDVKAAFSYAEQTARIRLAHPLAQVTLAMRDFEAGKFALAREHLKVSADAKSADFTSSILIAWTYAGEHNLKMALQTLDKTVSSKADLAPFRDFHAGLMASILGDNAEAELRLKSSFEASKGDLLSLGDAYGRFLSNRGANGAAAQVYDRLAAKFPHHQLIASVQKDLAEGKKLELMAKTPQEGAADALYQFGYQLSRLNERSVEMEQDKGPPQALDLIGLIYLRLSLYLRPDHQFALLETSQLLADRFHQADEAIKMLESIAPASPFKLGAQADIIKTLQTSGQMEAALARAQVFAHDNPQNLLAQGTLAQILESNKKYGEAIGAYNGAIALIKDGDHSAWTYYYRRGIAYERDKQWPRAEDDFRKALHLSPDQPSVLNYLGYSWVDKGVNLDEALRMLRRAVELEMISTHVGNKKSMGETVDSLGWAYFKLGRYNEAMEELTQAVMDDPGESVLNDHLGDAFWRNGRKNEAYFQWAHARDYNPEPNDLPHIQDKLAHGLPDEPKTAQAAPASAPATNPPAQPQSGPPELPAVKPQDQPKNGGAP